jgi:uncharacterized protein involved in type VI secretion and phage assembly
VARHHRLVFGLQAGAFVAADIAVVRLTGEEALSELFDFQVEFFPIAQEPLDTCKLLGKLAALSLRDPEMAERFIHGRVKEVADLGLRHGRPKYRVRLRPTPQQRTISAAAASSRTSQFWTSSPRC